MYEYGHRYVGGLLDSNATIHSQQLNNPVVRLFDHPGACLGTVQPPEMLGSACV